MNKKSDIPTLFWTKKNKIIIKSTQKKGLLVFSNISTEWLVIYHYQKKVILQKTNKKIMKNESAIIWYLR